MKILITRKTALMFVFMSYSIFQTSCQKHELNRLDIAEQVHSEIIEDDPEQETPDQETGVLAATGSCLRANFRQLAQVNEGNDKLNEFLNRCRAETKNSAWCDQVARPNPNSHNTFDCTYSASQPHLLIHPDTNTWSNAIEAVRIVKSLQQKRIKVCAIYNWWRPEPYNNNVGGAAGRHPFGTSVDVRFCSKNDQLLAHKELCKLRKQGRLRALGFYSGTGLHLGIGDKVANTWGKSCPK